MSQCILKHKMFLYKLWSTLKKLKDNNTIEITENFLKNHIFDIMLTGLLHTTRLTPVLSDCEVPQRASSACTLCTESYISVSILETAAIASVIGHRKGKANQIMDYTAITWTLLRR